MSFTNNITYILKRYEDSIIIVAISDINNYKATEMIDNYDYKTLMNTAYKLANRLGEYTYKNVLYRG